MIGWCSLLIFCFRVGENYIKWFPRTFVFQLNFPDVFVRLTFLWDNTMMRVTQFHLRKREFHSNIMFNGELTQIVCTFTWCELTLSEHRFRFFFINCELCCVCNEARRKAKKEVALLILIHGCVENSSFSPFLLFLSSDPCTKKIACKHDDWESNTIRTPDFLHHCHILDAIITTPYTHREREKVVLVSLSSNASDRKRKKGERVKSICVLTWITCATGEKWHNT